MLRRFADPLRVARRPLPLVATLVLSGAGLPVSAFPAAAAAAQDAQDVQTGPSLVDRAIVLGSDMTSLTLEFDDGRTFELVLSDGRAEVDGDAIGRFAVGGALESAWRQLLAGTAEADDATLAAQLVEWTPPSDLAGDDEGTATAIDRALEDALSGVSAVGREAVTVDAPSAASDVASAEDEASWRERIRAELRAELAREFEENARERRTRNRDDDREQGPIGRVFGGIGGAVANLVSVLVLGLLAFVAIHFARPGFERAAGNARRRAGASLLAGLAGTFLFLPVFVLGILALVLSIIGIPALLLWIPLFPAAVTLAALFGYLAVASNIGRWLAGIETPWADTLRRAGDVTATVGGLLVLAAPFIAANLVSVLPFTGALEALLLGTGGMAVAVVLLMGFGAVLLALAGIWRERRAPAPETFE